MQTCEQYKSRAKTNLSNDWSDKRAKIYGKRGWCGKSRYTEVSSFKKLI